MIKRPDFDTFGESEAVETLRDAGELLNDITLTPRRAAFEIMLFIALFMGPPLILLPIINWALDTVPGFGQSMFGYATVNVILLAMAICFQFGRTARRRRPLDGEDAFQMRANWSVEQAKHET